jgi:hypothetical protein
MKERMIIVAISILVSFSAIISQPKSPFADGQYWPDVWLANSNNDRTRNWGGVVLPDTGLWGKSEIGSNESVGGYPNIISHYVGVSDTFKVTVALTNDDTVSLNINSDSVSGWFVPKVYDMHADVNEGKPLKTPSSFGYRFAYWENRQYKPVPPPKVLASTSDSSLSEDYILVYHLWGLSAGRYRVSMDTTPAAPVRFQMLPNLYRITSIFNPTSAKDTINAYVGCIWRAISRSDLTAASIYVNKILRINPSSYPGFAMKAIERAANLDSLGYITAVDSVIAIMERYGDPLVPARSMKDRGTERFYNSTLNYYKDKRWELVNRTYRQYE